TTGDKQQRQALSSFGGQGVFVKEIEAELRAGRIDAAVHSAKDLAAADPEDLELVAFLEREAPHDVLVRRAPEQVRRPPGSGFVLATGSPRRRAQLADAWPGVDFVDIRGNVDTRLGKLERGDADGLVLAAAGLRRLEIE